ncbi:general secretion pathway protein GspB [Caenimonas aquaedulcis]|uniref:General secretion pathway protein GspB n=1 Tax=Caenimonas aquaedulcis TaxID=2793270 RepID=A0A931H2E6_9BURK|nr:general secretion pathway protein GspB [Caenimonas aquaedulcis]MBG9387254.1 general secretion pathway protein GspB [Caenimonas aquaedulcis]
MSYILDALRKADAQREGDPARGIHAQPLQGGGGEAPGWRAKRSLLWAGGIAGLGAIALAAWALRPVPAAPGPAQDVAIAPQAPMRATPPAPAAQVLPPPVVVARAPLIPSPSVVPVQAPAPLAMQASRPEPAPLIAAPAATGQPQGMTPLHGPQGPGMQPQPAGPAPGYIPPPVQGAAPRGPMPPAQPMPPVQGLPADAPKIVINGGVYSANKAQRMLIVNGQVAAEGADLGSGVRLEQITAKSAVLSFRGARYTVGY